jgi:hypothetical protein
MKQTPTPIVDRDSGYFDQHLIANWLGFLNILKSQKVGLAFLFWVVLAKLNLLVSGGLIAAK